MGIKTKPLWDYIRRREEIRLARLAGRPWPWTKDDILRRFKFTNVKRIHDKTTQAFLIDYQANRKATKSIALYNCGLRRFTGTVEAAKMLGWVQKHDTQWIGEAEHILYERAPKANFWTGAYMVRGGAKGVPKYVAVGDYLGALWAKASEITDRMEEERSWRAGYYILKTCYGFGGNGFMGKEVLQDYLLWRACRGGAPLSDEDTFTPVGPGARRGLNRLLGRDLLAPMKEEDGLADIWKLRAVIDPLWVGYFKAPSLTAHDIQFCLCELDKYERVRLGQGRPRSTYRPPAVPTHQEV
jgi:hypothetical protein